MSGIESGDFVVKYWYVSRTPSPEGVYVEVLGRRSGLSGWLLNLAGISPTKHFRVTQEAVYDSQSDHKQTTTTVVPVAKLVSVTSGVVRPWRLAVTAFFLACFLVAQLMGALMDSNEPLPLLVFGSAGGLASALLILKYLRKLAFWVTDEGGVRTAPFVCRPSVIEGQDIDEDRVHELVEVLAALILSADPMRAPASRHDPLAAMPAPRAEPVTAGAPTQVMPVPVLAPEADPVRAGVGAGPSSDAGWWG